MIIVSKITEVLIIYCTFHSLDDESEGEEEEEENEVAPEEEEEEVQE